MEAFPASFLLLFFEVALGGLFALSATPFHELERGFYKSTAGVLFVVGFLGLLGKSDIHLQFLSRGIGLSAALEWLFYLCFLAVFALYLFSLWGEHVIFRARTFSCSLFFGLAGLALSGRSFSLASFWSIETCVYPLGFLLSALLLGGVTVGMLIGHWYLIDTGQTIEPFIRIFRFFVAALGAQAIYFLVMPGLLLLLGNPQTLLKFRLLWGQHPLLLWSRLVIGQAAPWILSVMIWRTLKIPHTMAATGLFYIALLSVFVGELLGRQILALTSLPF